MKQKYKILLHALFWFYMINQSLFPMYLNKVATEYLQNHLYLKDVVITTLLNIFAFYLVYNSIPFLMRYKKKWYIFLLIIPLIGMITCIQLPIERAYWRYIVQLPVSDLDFTPEWVFGTLRYSLIMSIYAMLIRFSIDWFDSQKYKDELIKQQQASEIALLRSQVNPHFLFNTLNNIYSLVYNKSDEAPEAVMKLSSIMRYMLYDSNTNIVPLNKEIEYLNCFIELQQLRFTQKGLVELSVHGSMEKRTIAPMVLIPFVENAFKHGDKNHEPGIIIELRLVPGKIIFSVENFIRQTPPAIQEESGGFGLQNIKRRLRLLYPEKHFLLINKSDDKFKVELTILN